MANVVNLNQFRKKRLRDEKEARASANRAKHGRTKAEKNATAKTETDRNRALDGKKLETPDEN